MNPQSNPAELYGSIDEIEAVVRRFEACTFAAGEFKHREHLTVILWYLTQFDMPEAAARMRAGLYKFLDHHGVNRRKYHETITIFWVRKVRALLSQREGERSLVEMANEIIAACGDAKLINDYYSQELIASAAAREGWVEPDLQPLDF